MITKREERLGKLADAIDELEGEPIPFNLCRTLFEIREWIDKEVHEQQLKGDKGYRTEVPSDTRPGLMHTVMFSERDGFCCTCEDYTHRWISMGKDYECKHIKREKLKMEQNYVR